MHSKLIPLFVFSVFPFLIYSQTGNTVSASQNSNSSSLKVEWTVGELITESFKNSQLEAGHGMDELAGVFVITGDIDEISDQTSVYPTPFKNYFFIEMKEDEL